MNVSIGLQAVGVTVALIAMTVAVAGYRRGARLKRMEDVRNEFVDVRRVVRERQAELQGLALRDAPAGYRPGEVVQSFLLGAREWLPDEPLPISNVRLSYRDDDGPRDWESVLSRAAEMLPPMPGSRFRTTYSQALIELDDRRELFNGFVYRLLAVDTTRGFSLVFGPGRYFDYLDTGEVLAYEAARARIRGGKGLWRLPVRRALGNPFDFNRRATSCGVITLTVRRSPEGCGFFLHRRNPKAGEVASGQLHAVPAGEFAPSSITPEAVRDDLSLWKNIVREYAEEMLGVADARGMGGRIIDFSHDAPFREFSQAAEGGRMQTWFLGLGLDPLTWKPEIMSVCVFDAATFDKLFRDRLLAAATPGIDDRETEGTILMGVDARGIPFVEERIQEYLRSDMRDAGKTCLSLAWHHREKLGLVG